MSTKQLWSLAAATAVTAGTLIWWLYSSLGSGGDQIEPFLPAESPAAVESRGDNSEGIQFALPPTPLEPEASEDTDEDTTLTQCDANGPTCVAVEAAPGYIPGPSISADNAQVLEIYEDRIRASDTDQISANVDDISIYESLILPADNSHIVSADADAESTLQIYEQTLEEMGSTAHRSDYDNTTGSDRRVDADSANISVYDELVKSKEP